MDVTLGINRTGNKIDFGTRKTVARERFLTTRKITGAIALFSLLVMPLSYGIGSKDPTVVHLDGAETITGWKTDTNNWTFSDPNTTLLLGATSIPNLTSTIAGAQELIFTSASNSHWPLAIIGDYRNGTSGQRYFSGFAKDGHFTTNQYITIVGGLGASENGGSMESIWADVPVALSISNAVANDAHGGMLISGWGNFVQGMFPRVFAVSSQGTTTITNPYGEAKYTRPQFVLGDIGVDPAAPNWTYGSFHQHNGHLKIGTFDNGTAEGGELDVSSGQVSVAGNLVISQHTPSSATDAGVPGTVAWDSDYVYICVAPNTWKRASLGSW
jgi:hypothetical protein